MRRFLCVPGTFGRIPQGVLDEIASYGWDGVRLDVAPGDSELDHEMRWEQIQSFPPGCGSIPIFVLGPHHIDLRGGQLIEKSCDFAIKLVNFGFAERQDELAIEIGNEPDLAVDRWKDDPEGMGQCFALCYAAIRERLPSVDILCPSVSNLNERGFKYLRRMVRYIPKGCVVAFHRYPASQFVATPHKGFGSRPDEIKEVRAIAGGRRIINTETGWPEDNESYVLKEDEVADRVEEEDRLYESVDCDWTGYQINSAKVYGHDSPQVRRLKTYGYRRHDGTWKPSAERIRARATGEIVQ